MIAGQRYPKKTRDTARFLNKPGAVPSLIILTSYGPICLNSSAIKGEVMLWPESSANSRLPVEPDLDNASAGRMPPALA